jgi:hypothetical protein
MPQVLLPGDDTLTDCTFDDLARWDRLVADGTAANREQAASIDLNPPPAAEEWPLRSTSPAEYIEQHGEDPEPSETVAARLELARRLIAAEG